MAFSGEDIGFSVKQTWVSILPLLFRSWTINLRTFFKLSVHFLLCSYLCFGDHNSNIKELLWGLPGIKYITIWHIVSRNSNAQFFPCLFSLLEGQGRLWIALRGSANRARTWTNVDSGPQILKYYTKFGLQTSNFIKSSVKYQGQYSTEGGQWIRFQEMWVLMSTLLQVTV